MTEQNLFKEKLLRQFIFIAFGISGSAALIYEVVWTRSLSTVMGSSTYALSTMLAAFMAGLSIGGWIGGRLSIRVSNIPKSFAMCELGIGLTGLITIPIIKALTPFYIKTFYTFHLSFNSFSAVQFFIIFFIMGIPTTLMGITFPLIIKFFSERSSDVGFHSGRLYGINTLGAVLGSISAGFLLIPVVGTNGAAIIAASMNLMLASVILVLSRQARKLLAASVAFITITAFSNIIDTPDIPFFSYYSALRLGNAENAQKLIDNLKNDTSKNVLFHHDGIEGETYLMDYKGFNILYNNGKMESGDDVGFALLAYIPYMEHSIYDTPKRALNIGLGTGDTLKYLSQFPIERIDSVELNEDIIEVNRRFLIPNLFNDPRINHIQADGRNYLMLETEKYDLIISSPSWAIEMSSAEMLTDEFFTLVASKLNDSGIFATWIDYFLMSDEDLNTITRTFSRHFKHSVSWHIDGNNMILIGSNYSLPSETTIVKTIDSLWPRLTCKYRVSLSEKDINAIPPGEINTDEKPIIEFHNARNIILGPNVVNHQYGIRLHRLGEKCRKLHS